MHRERAPQEGMDSEKTTGCKERSQVQRRRVLRLRERYCHRGLQLVPVDTCGVALPVARHDGYAPKGQRVDDLISGHRCPYRIRV